MSLEPFDPDAPLTPPAVYTDIARAEIAAFEAVGRWFGRMGARFAAWRADRRRRHQAWRLRLAEEWRAFRSWLALAAKAKGESQHVQMAMHQAFLQRSVFNPFKFVSALLGVLLVAASGFGLWQFVRAESLAADNKSLKSENRTAVASSHSWKARAEQVQQQAERQAAQVAIDAAQRAEESRRSVTLAQETQTRRAGLARRQRERADDALRVQYGGPGQGGAGGGPVDFERRLRELETGRAAAAVGADDPAAPGGDPAAGVPAGSGGDPGVRAADPPAAAP